MGAVALVSSVDSAKVSFGKAVPSVGGRNLPLIFVVFLGAAFIFPDQSLKTNLVPPLGSASAHIDQYTLCEVRGDVSESGAEGMHSPNPARLLGADIDHRRGLCSVAPETYR